LAVILLLVGLRILVRFSRPVTARAHDEDAGPPSFEVRGAGAAAAAGGVTNGLVGAWGPIVTPYLLHHGLPPRYAIGSVNTAEVAVAVVAAGSLLASVGGDSIEAGTVLAMLLGGVVASPLAAWVTKHLSPRRLGLAVAALLLITNVRELAGQVGMGWTRWLLYAAVGIALVLAALRPRLAARRGRRSDAVDGDQLGVEPA
jgi:uncharacterized protein